MVHALIHILALTAPLAGQPIVLKADRQDVRVGEPFRLSVEIAGSDFTDLTAPKVDGLVFTTSPHLRNEIVLNVQGQRSKTVIQGYNVTADKPGTYTVPPFRARIDGRFAASNSVVITARAQVDSALADASNLPLEDLIQFSAELDKETAYEGEAVTLTLALRWLDGIPPPDERQLEVADMAGFYSVQPDWRSIRLDDVESNGNRFRGKGWTMVLFPTAPGDLAIQAAHLTLVAQLPTPYPGYRREVITLDSSPVTVSVKPIPARPPAFSGAVGQYDLIAEPPANTAEQGIPTSVVVWVKGAGNPNALGRPVFPELDWAHVRDPEKFNQPGAADGGTHVETRFTYSIVPHTIGRHRIPAVSYCYFDPASEVFVTRQAGPFELRVTAPDAADAADPDAAAESDSTDPDEEPTPLVTDPEQALAGLPPGPTLVWTGAMAAGPAGYALLVCALLMRRRSRARTGVTGAADRARRLLRQSEDVADPVQGVYRALVIYVAHRFQLPAAGLTANDIDAQLVGRGVDRDVVDALVRVLQACEQARYAARDLHESEVAALRHGAYSAIDRLERVAGETVHA